MSGNIPQKAVLAMSGNVFEFVPVTVPLSLLT
jgi:hypothetical protein